MSAYLLRQAAADLRMFSDDLGSGVWTYGPVDPRPNWGLFLGDRLVCEMNWSGGESSAFPRTLAQLLGLAEGVARWLEAEALTVEHHHGAWAQSDFIPDADAHVESMFAQPLAVARAILREQP